MIIELCVAQFWSEIILVISNQTRAARSFDFEITRIISDQIAIPLSSITIINLGLNLWRHIVNNKLMLWTQVCRFQKEISPF